MTRHEYVLWGAKAIAKRGVQLPHVKLCEERVRYIRANPRGLTARRHRETWGHVL